LRGHLVEQCVKIIGGVGHIPASPWFKNFAMKRVN
jgi:hypothetical protein